MRRLAGAFIVVCVVVPEAAHAHRLDEYLQATRIALAQDGVVVEIDLTPGVSIAPQILRGIDANEDGRIDPLELEAYARSVIRDLSIEIDGRAHGLELAHTGSSSLSELAEGTGTIRVQLRVATGVSGGGTHVVRFENRHQRDVSVYLVNALVPSTRSIEVLGQRRDERQRAIEIDVRVTARLTALLWLFAPFVAVCGLAIARTQVKAFNGPRAEGEDRRGGK